MADVDRLLIHEVIARHGHLVDEGDLDGLVEVFLPDVAYEVTALGGTVLRGCDAVAEAGRALGERNPLAHHVSNIVVERLDGDRATARSKGLAVMSDGSTGSVVYLDEFLRSDDGAWRIARRVVLPRRKPLTSSG